MSIDGRVLWAVLLAWVTITAIRDPGVATIAGTVACYWFAYLDLTDSWPEAI